MPYQVNLLMSGWLLPAMCLIAGCASEGRKQPSLIEPLSFPDAGRVPRIEVYGRLDSLLPKYDRTPPIEKFLYGPNDFGKTALRNPQGMGLVGGTLLICDQGRPAIVAINLATGQSLLWGDADHQPRCPVDLAVEGAEKIYVADSTLCALLVYDHQGHFLEELRPEGTEKGRGFKPSVVLATHGMVYVGNMDGHRIDRWDVGARRWLQSIAPPASDRPLIAPTGLAMTSDDVLLIADAIQGQVFRMGHDQQWLSPIGKRGRGPGELVRPKQVLASASGFVFVTDAGRQSVMVFDAKGGFLTEVHEKVERWEGFTLPMGLCLLQIDDLPGLSVTDRTRPEVCVLVSDTLGGSPLTVLGIVTHAKEP